jgi:hypothetical protein
LSESWAVRDQYSKQVVQRHRLAPLIFLKGLSCHTPDHMTFFSEALFPSVFVGHRRQDLGRNRILLILRQGNDFFQRSSKSVDASISSADLASRHPTR